MHLFGGRHRGKRTYFVLTVSADTENIVMVQAIVDQYGVDIENNYGPVRVDINVLPNVIVSAEASSEAPPFDLRGSAAGSIINLTNQGWLLGAGGRGGDGSLGGNGSGGTEGGTAILGPDEGSTLNITNGSGRIFGGGGGGGGGGRANKFVDGPDEPVLARGGGGGGGAGPGSEGGAGGTNVALGGDTPAQDGTAGTGGKTGTGGDGGNGGNAGFGAHGGDGGDGGDYGQPGTAGSSGSGSSPGPNGLGGSGGAAGAAVQHFGATINWISGNTASRVKGEVVDAS